MKQAWQFIKNLLDILWRWFEKLITILGGQTIAMLAVALLIALASIVFTDNWIISINKQGVVIGQIRDNIIILQELKANLYQAESAQRGYLITGRDAYLTPFNQAMLDARANLAKVESFIKVIDENEIVSDADKALSQADAQDSEWLKAILVSLEVKAAEMQVTLSLRKTGKAKEARQIVNLDDGLKATQSFIQNTDKLLQHQNKRLDNLIAARQNTILLARVSVIGGALTLILLVVLVIKQLLSEIAIKGELQLRVQKENVIYEEKLQQKTKLLRSLALDYQADVERERQKLSRELHDELGSIFTATKMDIAWVIKKVKDTIPDIAEKLKKTSIYVDQGIQFQRHIVQELHPAMLTTFGFWPALNSLITDAAERNNWQLTLNLPDENIKLNETISLVAYRIVQETLNNANKYAKATAVSVDVIVDEKHIKLEIQDNGVGIDTQSTKEKTHGLAGMRHRVLAIGGHFDIVSEPNKGVLTRALIPIDFEAA